MSANQNTCSKCGGKSIVKGDIGLRTSRDLELIMVVRKDHGVEKKVPLQPKVCGKCGFVDLYVSEAKNLRIQPSDKPIAADARQRPILEYDF
ncbi:MAG: hypothetical protein JSU88_10855 [Nitrospinaceae bacterium]|jgi:predicted nucleic-acid-binding Zn-ribbon protein|nr:MAG: hypothetical protein JSU88_10855 [Nitrospinaceae bacterium]